MKARPFVRRVWAAASDKNGAASVLLVASLPLFFLVTGLAIDSSGAFSEQTVLQDTANAAALAAGLDLRTHGDNVVADAQSYALKNLPSAKNGTVLASSDVQVGNWSFSCSAHDSTCFVPCQNQTITSTQLTCTGSGGATVNIDAVRVLVRRSTDNRNPFPTTFLELPPVGRSAWNVSALAVAAIGPNGGDCFVSTSSVTVKNNANITTDGCNSLFEGTLSGNALGAGCGSGNGGNCVSALDGGAITFGPNASPPSKVALSGTQIQNAPAPNDPYANTPVPACNAAMMTSTFSSSTAPGSCITGSVTIGQNVTINLQPGFYVFNAAQVAFGNSATISGSGVTLFLTHNSQFANTSGPSNSATFNFSAPTTGTFQGIAIFGVGPETIGAPGNGSGAGNPCGTPNNSFSLLVTGAIYFPGGTMCLKNGTVGSANTCTQLVVGTLVVNNNLSISEGTNCSSAGTFAIGHARLVL